MVKNILRFPSDEWIHIFKEEVNKNKTYQEVARDWEGDFLFIITPDEELKEETVFYIDLWHGKCRDAYLVSEIRLQRPLFELEESHQKRTRSNPGVDSRIVHPRW
jgi:hypothetical protein